MMIYEHDIEKYMDNPLTSKLKLKIKDIDIWTLTAKYLVQEKSLKNTILFKDRS